MPPLRRGYGKAVAGRTAEPAADIQDWKDLAVEVDDAEGDGRRLGERRHGNHGQDPLNRRQGKGIRQSIEVKDDQANHGTRQSGATRVSSHGESVSVLDPLLHEQPKKRNAPTREPSSLRRRGLERRVRSWGPPTDGATDEKLASELSTATRPDRRPAVKDSSSSRSSRGRLAQDRAVPSELRDPLDALDDVHTPGVSALNACRPPTVNTRDWQEPSTRLGDCRQRFRDQPDPIRGANPDPK